KFGALSPDGNLLAYGTKNGDVKVLRTFDGSEVYSYQGIFDGSKSISSLAFNKSSQLIAFGSDSGDIKVRDLKTGGFKILKGQNEPVHGIAFSSDSKILVSAGSDDTVRIWDISAQRQLQPSFKGHEDVVKSIAFSPDNKTIASGSS